MTAKIIVAKPIAILRFGPLISRGTIWVYPASINYAIVVRDDVKHRHLSFDYVFRTRGLLMFLWITRNDWCVFEFFQAFFNGGKVCVNVVADLTSVAVKIAYLPDDFIASIRPLDKLLDLHRQIVNALIVSVKEKRRSVTGEERAWPYVAADSGWSSPSITASILAEAGASDFNASYFPPNVRHATTAR
jgi:hypothetical protein